MPVLVATVHIGARRRRSCRCSSLLAAFCVQGIAARCGASWLGAGVAAGCRGCAFSWSLEEGCVLIQPCVGGEGCAFD